MRIAVASSDGNVVNQHFGKATRFLIFETDGNSVELTGIRENAPSCGTEEFGGHNDDALKRAISLISDCEAVLCSRIGQGAYDELMGHDIFPFEARDFIEEAIKKYLNYKKAAGKAD